MKIALVHDFLKEYGGAERVLEALHEIYPGAPVYTAFVNPVGLGPHWERIKKWDIRTSWVEQWWPVKALHSPLRFLAPLIWESFNFDEYEVVISSSGWYICRGILTKPETLHICYLHHPPRHLYGYKTALEWQRFWPVRAYGYLVNHYLRMYDYLAAQRVEYFIANSEETKRRIAKFYRRESVVIYPPVKYQISNIPSARAQGEGKYQISKPKKYFLYVGRLARAKNIHLAIEACNKLGCQLWVVGAGREENDLKSIAGPTIKFLGQVSDKGLPEIYQGAKALIFPAEDEEFGIVPVEAMAHGLPVIALRSGGVVESVVDSSTSSEQGATGIFFDKPTVESLAKAIKSLDRLMVKPEDCKKQAKKFSKTIFKQKITDFVEEKLKEHHARIT